VAAGGGGSWKVAYADFVTAMMAFFMVMWICAQDQQTREAVAHYFNEPFQFFKDPVGAGRKPEGGAVFQKKSSGHVHESERTAMENGRQTYSQAPGPSPATKTVSDWLMANDAASKYWRGQAAQAMETAARSTEARGDPALIEETAARVLAEQMATELKGEARPKTRENLHDDLLAQALSEVNWTELAEDLLRHERLPPAVPSPRRESPR
jgi:flagellar motor protein MotB